MKKSYAISLYGEYCIELYELINDLHLNRKPVIPDSKHWWSNHFESKLLNNRLRNNNYLDDIIIPLIKITTITINNGISYFNADALSQLDSSLKESVSDWLSAKEATQITGLSRQKIEGEYLKTRRYKSNLFYDPVEINDLKERIMRKKDFSKNKDKYLRGNSALGKYLKPYLPIGIIDYFEPFFGNMFLQEDSALSQFFDCLLNIKGKFDHNREFIYVKSLVDEKIKQLIKNILSKDTTHQRIQKLLTD